MYCNNVTKINISFLENTKIEGLHLRTHFLYHVLNIAFLFCYIVTKRTLLKNQ
jgi:hypothetical protein